MDAKIKDFLQTLVDCLGVTLIAIGVLPPIAKKIKILIKEVKKWRM